MSDTLSIPDSQSDEEIVPITRNIILELENREKQEKIWKRQEHLLKELAPLTDDFLVLPTTRSRRHAFAQRHIYTSDLAEYLHLATRMELNKLSKDGSTDEEIFHMLERKYRKIRKFYRRVGLKLYRFKKKSFSLLVKDFRHYQTSRGGRTYYELAEPVPKDKHDLKQLQLLYRQDLSDVSSTEDETTDDEQIQERQPSTSPDNGAIVGENDTDRDSEVVTDSHRNAQLGTTDKQTDLTSKFSLPGTDTKSVSMCPQKDATDANDTSSTEAGDADSEVIHDSLKLSSSVAPSQCTLEEDDTSNKPMSIQIADSPTNSQCSLTRTNDQDQIQKSDNITIDNTNDHIGSDSNILHQESYKDGIASRMRRHKFSQDHVYVADTSVHLGLCTLYKLNEMYDSGKSYSDIMLYLEKMYRQKRELLLNRDLPLGPFSKRTYKEYLDEENRRLGGFDKHFQGQAEDTLNGFLDIDDSNTSDDEYLQPDSIKPVQKRQMFDEDILETGYDSTSSSSNGSSVYDIPSDNKAASPAPSKSSDDSIEGENFVFRNKLLNKRTALRGVLPASFYKVNDNKRASSVAEQYRKPNPLKASYIRPEKGRARRINGTHGHSDNYKHINDDFLVATESQATANADPAEYHRMNLDLQDIADPLASDNISDTAASQSNLNDIEASIGFSNSDDNDDDDAIGIDDYDNFARHMRDDMDMDASAEEDDHAGINYMLSRAPRTKRPVTYASRKRKRSKNTSMSSFRNSSYKSSSKHQTRFRRTWRLHAHPIGEHNSQGESISHFTPARNHPHASKPRNHIFGSIRQRTSNKRNLSSKKASYQYGNLKKKSLRSNKNVFREEHMMSEDKQDDLKLKSKRPSNILAGDYFMLNKGFYFGRKKVIGTPQIEESQVLSAKETEFFDDQTIANTRKHKAFDTIEMTAETDSIDLTSHNTQIQIADIRTELFSSLQLSPKSVVYSGLIQESLKLDGDYHKNGSISFEFGSVAFTLSTFNVTGELKASLKVLLDSMRSSLNAPKIAGPETLNQMRKCLIQIIQLLWNINCESPQGINEIGELLLSFCRSCIILASNKKMNLIALPYQMIYMQLLQTFTSVKKLVELHDYNREFNHSQEQYVTLFCKMPVRKIVRYFRTRTGIGSLIYESACLMMLFAVNPWGQVANLSSSFDFPFDGVIGFLYFCHSRIPVSQNWDYFLLALDNLKQRRNSAKWKVIFQSVQKVHYDLSWDIEESVLLKMYRLLSYVRFENVGSNRSSTLWYSSLPVTTQFMDRDGCLDMYMKLLVYFVNNCVSPARKSVLVEKLVPIASIKTSTITLLRNRANLMLVMSYLFKADFIGHFRVILKALLEFRTPESYKASLDLLLVVTRCYFNLFHHVSFDVIQMVLPEVISALNNDEVSITPISDSLRNIVDCIDNQLSRCPGNNEKLALCVDLACILLKLKKVDFHTKAAYVSLSVLQMLRQVIEITDKVILKSIETKLKDELIPLLKNVIAADAVFNDILKVRCLYLWIYLSSKLNVTAGSLAYIEWQYFSNELARTRFELPFYTAMLKFYRPVDLRYLHETFFIVLMRNLPLESKKYFIEFFTSLAAQKFMQKYVKFRSGLDPSNFTEVDLRLYHQQLSVKILSCLVKEIKESEVDQKRYKLYIVEFVKALEGEYVRLKNSNLQMEGYTKYATRLVRYLCTVLNNVVGSVPEFVLLKRQLSITTILTSLSDELESMSSSNEVYLLLLSKYFTALKDDTWKTFRKELVGYCLDKGGFVDDDQRLSSVIPLSIIISTHIPLVLHDRNNWYHFCNWITIFADVICSRAMFTTDDLIHIIKSLTLMTKLAGTSRFPLIYYENEAVINVYRILQRLNYYLLGSADRLDFIHSINTLRGLDNTVTLNVNRDLFLSFSSSSLNRQVELIYKRNRELLSTQLLPPITESMLNESNHELSLIRNKVMGLFSSNSSSSLLEENIFFI